MTQEQGHASSFEIAPAGVSYDGDDRRAPLSDALSHWGQFSRGQTAGRFYPMACVSLEVTQRCNLDCTLCYLSDLAEIAHDPPLQTLFDRIDMVESHYGPRTSIQISGGDPTLRKIEDLEALCRYIRSKNMRSCLMTNGIKATRAMLARLAAAGLDDVAFHVDLTQERKGYATEESLNAVRDAYIERAQGLGLRLLFNTTVHDGNLRELPAITRFFKRRADRLTLVSFQMQADTGRGVLRAREAAITPASVAAKLSEGMGAALDFDVAAVGHADCNRYACALVAGDEAVSALSDRELLEDWLEALEQEERRSASAYLDVAATSLRVAWRRPKLALRALWFLAAAAWRLRRGLIQSRGRAHRLSVLVHNFMDASKLEQDRCESCVFMVMTRDGPLSMCAHNARRDQHVFAPIPVRTASTQKWWSAASGALFDAETAADVEPRDLSTLPLKRLKGRRRRAGAALNKK